MLPTYEEEREAAQGVRVHLHQIRGEGAGEGGWGAGLSLKSDSHSSGRWVICGTRAVSGGLVEDRVRNSRDRDSECASEMPSKCGSGGPQ